MAQQLLGDITSDDLTGAQVTSVRGVAVVNEYRSCTVQFILERGQGSRASEFADIVSPVDPTQAAISTDEVNDFANKIAAAGLAKSTRINALSEFHRYHRSKDTYVPIELNESYYGRRFTLAESMDGSNMIHITNGGSHRLPHSTVADEEVRDVTLQLLMYIKKTNGNALNKLVMAVSGLHGSMGKVMLDSPGASDLAYGIHYEFVIPGSHEGAAVASSLNALSYACLAEYRGDVLPCYTEIARGGDRHLHIFDSIQCMVKYLRMRAAAKVLSIASQMSSGSITVQFNRFSFLPRRFSQTLEAYGRYLMVRESVIPRDFDLASIAKLDVKWPEDPLAEMLQSYVPGAEPASTFIYQLIDSAHVFAGALNIIKDVTQDAQWVDPFPEVSYAYTKSVSQDGKLGGCGLGLIASIATLAWQARVLDIVDGMARQSAGAYGEAFEQKQRVLSECAAFTRASQVDRHILKLSARACAIRMGGDYPEASITNRGKIVPKLLGGVGKASSLNLPLGTTYYELEGDILFMPMRKEAGGNIITREDAVYNSKELRSGFRSLRSKLLRDVALIDGVR
jgi:hypothetical protein